MKSKTPLTDAAHEMFKTKGLTCESLLNMEDLSRKLELENQSLRGLLAETCDFVNRKHNPKYADERSLRFKLEEATK